MKQIYCSEDMCTLGRPWHNRQLNSVIWRVIEHIVETYGVRYV